MESTLDTPTVKGLGEVFTVPRTWQHDDAPMQLHPGDLGWLWRFGADATAAAIRTWRRAGRLVAIGLLDGPTMLRLTLAPDAHRDEELTRLLVADLTDPRRGVLPAGRVAVETPTGTQVSASLSKSGWHVDAPWTPLQRLLAEPVPDPAVRTEVIGPDQAATYAEIIRSAFGSSAFTGRRWLAMASGDPYVDARSLLAYDGHGVAVAAVTVWSAGPGRPGLLEPMGVHQDHRGLGYGRAITIAAAAALAELGCSSAAVCTPESNVGGVATYESAGYRRLPERRDRYREPGTVAVPVFRTSPGAAR